MSEREDSKGLFTFGEHLEILRKMLFRIIAVIGVIGVAIFCFKEETFAILLAPRNSDFITFCIIEQLLGRWGMAFNFPDYNIQLINTELSAQFMTHISVSCVMATLLASPYILFELFRFVSPALYESEKRNSYIVVGVVYLLFLIGVLMSYFILFPISFQFLANYQVDKAIVNTITLESYISTFTTLTFMMGIVFQLPVLAFAMGKMGFIDADILRRYRAYAFIFIMIIAAIITPPDVFTLILVTIPICVLYEVSIIVLKGVDSRHQTDL